MATWEDGPEYAPAYAPDEFAAPAVDPLDAAPEPDPAAPQSVSEAAPVAPPTSYRLEPQPPLASLVPRQDRPQRDPGLPFAVAASGLTDSRPAAWDAAHGTSDGWGPQAPGAVGPAPAPPVYDPTRPFLVSASTPSGEPPAHAWASPSGQAGFPVPGGQFPAPGTPQWFGPGPAGAPAPEAPQTGADVIQAVGRGVGIPTLICLVVGLIPLLSLPMFALAQVLRRRGTIAKATVAKGYLIGLALVVISAIANLISGAGLDGFTQAVAVINGLLLIFSVLVVLHHVLRPAGTSSWG